MNDENPIEGLLARFLRSQPVDVTGTPFAQPPNAIADGLPQFLTGRQTQAQQRAVDPQSMGHDRFHFDGGGTATKESNLMWGDALASPMQRKIGEALGGETGSKAMMLANFLGPAVKLPTPAMAASGAGGGAKGIRAYHGSPHDFDRFSLDKVGTGDGGQVFGRGLNFSDNESLARGYRDRLADYSKAVQWKGAEPPTPMQQSLVNRLSGPDSSGNPMTIDKLRAELARDARQQQAVMDGNVPFGKPMPEAKKWVDQAHAQIAELEKIAPHIAVTQPGKMYEVNIKADPRDFLDWDAPLSAQSEKVRGAFPEMKPEWTGAQVHESSKLVPGDFMDKAAAQAELRKRGIPGIKYGAEGGSNYVVVDDGIVDIIRKYGLLPLVPGTIAATQGGGNNGNNSDY